MEILVPTAREQGREHQVNRPLPDLGPLATSWVAFQPVQTLPPGS